MRRAGNVLNLITCATFFVLSGQPAHSATTDLLSLQINGMPCSLAVEEPSWVKIFKKSKVQYVEHNRVDDSIADDIYFESEFYGKSFDEKLKKFIANNGGLENARTKAFAEMFQSENPTKSLEGLAILYGKRIKEGYLAPDR